MATDYQNNPRRSDPRKAEEKDLTPVTTGEVIVQKKTLGRKFRELIVVADFSGVTRYVVYDILIPAFRNTLVDAAQKGIERAVFGESAIRRRNYGDMYGPGPRYSYNANPMQHRNYRDVSSRVAGTPRPGRSYTRRAQDDYILSSREEAELLLEKMNDIIESFNWVSVADLNKLLRIESPYTDNDWGWSFLGGVRIFQIPEGWLIDFPPAEPIR